MDPERGQGRGSAARANRHLAPSRSPARLSAAQPRETARRTPARRRPPRSRLCLELCRLGVVPGDRARDLARSCQAGRTERAPGRPRASPGRSEWGLAPSGVWSPASATLVRRARPGGGKVRNLPHFGGTSNLRSYMTRPEGSPHWQFRLLISGDSGSSQWDRRGFSSFFPLRSRERKDKTMYMLYSCYVWARSQ